MYRIVAISTVAQASLPFVLLFTVGLNAQLDKFFLLVSVVQIISNLTILPTSGYWLSYFLKRGQDYYNVLGAYIHIIGITSSIPILLFTYFFDESWLVFFLLFLATYLQLLVFGLYPIYHAEKRYFFLEGLQAIGVLVQISIIFLFQHFGGNSDWLPILLASVLVRTVVVLTLSNRAIQMFPSLTSKSDWKEIRLCLNDNIRIVFSTSVSRFDPLVDRTILIAFPEGTLSTFHLMQQAYTLLNGVVSKLFVAPRMPGILHVFHSSSAARKNRIVRALRISWWKYFLLTGMLGCVVLLLVWTVAPETWGIDIVTITYLFLGYSVIGANVLFKEIYTIILTSNSFEGEILRADVIAISVSLGIKFLSFHYVSVMAFAVALALSGILRIHYFHKSMRTCALKTPEFRW